MDTEKPQVSRKAKTKEEENAQKCLDVILNYSRNSNKQREYVAHPQTMLKDDLKRDFGCTTGDDLGINQQIIAGKKLEVENCHSFQSIKSNEINEFINKYICSDGSTNNYSKPNNTVALKHNELFRLKAGGLFLSRPMEDTPLEIPGRNKPVRVCTCPPDKSKSMRRLNIKYHEEKNLNLSDMEESLNLEIVHAKSGNNESNGLNKASVKRLIDRLLSDQIDRSEEIAAQAQRNNIMDSSSETNKQTMRHFMEALKSSDNLESNENKERDVSCFLKSMVSDNIERSETINHVSFAPEPQCPVTLDSNVNSSDDTEDDNSEDQEKITTNGTTKAKVTILEFDRIFNEEVKRRRGKDSNSDLTHPSVKVKTENNTKEEVCTSVKTALIHSAVTGLPHDIPFNEDFELMNAIDKFIQADNACKFEEALRAAEQAAKSAPAGFEEEAAASAAKNYQFQCDQRDNFNTILLDEKKKPIEIVAYVGSTNAKKNPPCSEVLKSK